MLINCNINNKIEIFLQDVVYELPKDILFINKKLRF